MLPEKELVEISTSSFCFFLIELEWEFSNILLPQKGINVFPCFVAY